MKINNTELFKRIPTLVKPNRTGLYSRNRIERYNNANDRIYFQRGLLLNGKNVIYPGRSITITTRL